MGGISLKGSQGADFALEDKGALCSKGCEDALLGSRGNRGISLKGSQGADFALEDKGALCSKDSENADLGLENFNSLSLRGVRQHDVAADFRTDGVEDEVRANPDSEQKERTCGEATNSDSLRAWRKSKTI
ncbi:hypothetical protein IJ732_05175, partial [bacterium]|nr:hypothetical protein [bacterium]